MTVFEWNFMQLSTVKYETNDHEIHEHFTNIQFQTNTADLVFVPSEDREASVTCYEQKNVKHTVTVKDGTLTIEVVDTRKWYEHIGIFFGTPKITVTIPQGEYGALSIKSNTGDVEIPKEFRFASMDIAESTGDVTSCASVSGAVAIKTSTGNIRVENISAGTLDLAVSTGEVAVSNITCTGDVKIQVSTGHTQLSDVTCKKVTSTGRTGAVSLKNVIATEAFSIERSTGDVKFDGCDAAEIVVKTSTGDVTGSLLSDKIFVAESDTGRVDVPQAAAGGRCTITTDTGDIRIKIEP